LDADHRDLPRHLLADFFPWACSVAPGLKAVAEEDADKPADPWL
jgi:hypothetical protein